MEWNSRANGFGSSCYYSPYCCCYEYEVFLSSSSGHFTISSSCWKDRTSSSSTAERSTAQREKKEKGLCWLDAGKDKPGPLSVHVQYRPLFIFLFCELYANPSLLLFYWIHSWIQPTDPAVAAAEATTTEWEIRKHTMNIYILLDQFHLDCIVTQPRLANGGYIQRGQQQGRLLLDEFNYFKTFSSRPPSLFILNKKIKM